MFKKYGGKNEKKESDYNNCNCDVNYNVNSHKT